MGMTLDEAIKHCEEVAEKNEKQASWFWGKEGNPNYENCVECAAEHRQLAEWLRKYQKIEQILKDIPYGGDATVRRIQEVVENEND